MMNERLIEDAVQTVISYYEAEGIYEQTQTIRDRAISWYNNTEIVDKETLAAVVMYGKYEPLTINQIYAIKEFFFPTEFDDHGYYYEDYDEYYSDDEISIWEIEESYHDDEWR